MARPTEKLVSILGSSYFQPIANLVERWHQWTHHRPNKVQSGFYEHGYSASVILLLVAMFESYIVRLSFPRLYRHLTKEENDAIGGPHEHQDPTAVHGRV